MADEADIMRAADAAVRALRESEGRFVRIGDGDGSFLLALRRRGEEIDDPDCDHVFGALAGGVFRRCSAEIGGAASYRWLHLGPCDPEFLAEALRADLEAMEPEDLKAVPMDVAIQSILAWRKGPAMF